MKKNKLTTSKRLRSLLENFFDWTKWPEGFMYYNPYLVKWKRGRPSKEAYELRDWATGWDLYFYEAYPRHAPGYHFKQMMKSIIGDSPKIKRTKGKRTLLVKYNQMVPASNS